MMWHGYIVYVCVYALLCFMIMNDSFMLRTYHRSSLDSNIYHSNYHQQHQQKGYTTKYKKMSETTFLLSTAVTLHDSISSSNRNSSVSGSNDIIKPKKIDNVFEKICLFILTKILSLYTHIPIPTTLHRNHHSIMNNKNSSSSNFGSYDKFVAISKVLVISNYNN